MSPEANRNLLEIVEEKLEKKVSWIVFAFIILMLLSLMGYLVSADAAIKSAVDKNEDRFYKYQQDTSEKLNNIQAQMSAVSQKLGVKENAIK